MKYNEQWDLEFINWGDPRDPDDYDAIGITGYQKDGKSDYAFSIIKFAPPDDVLYFIDPFFSMDIADHGSMRFLEASVDIGMPIAIPQVWITPEEYGYFPIDAWFTHRAKLLRRFNKKKRPTYEDFPEKDLTDLVRQHEGRHRTLLAREIGETEIPVQVWVQFK